MVSEITQAFEKSQIRPRFEEASSRFQLSATVAEYAEILRESYWAQDSSLSEVASEAERIRGLLPQDQDVIEFAQLASQAASIASSNP